MGSVKITRKGRGLHAGTLRMHHVGNDDRNGAFSQRDDSYVVDGPCAVGGELAAVRVLEDRARDAVGELDEGDGLAGVIMHAVLPTIVLGCRVPHTIRMENAARPRPARSPVGRRTSAADAA